jgi:hypothetical protein
MRNAEDWVPLPGDVEHWPRAGRGSNALAAWRAATAAEACGAVRPAAENAKKLAADRSGGHWTKCE